VAPGQAVAQEEAGGLEEIVVTARRREESLQDTPVSITAFSGEALQQQHIDGLEGIANMTPNAVIDTGTSFSGSTSSTAAFIRGIGQVDFTLVSEPGVAIYLDGVYIPHSIGSLLDLVDVERVEVLRGPQGTLFGRNTIGGAINVTSRLPDDEFHGDVRITGGRYDRIDAQARVNVPISEQLAAKVSLATFNRDGFVAAPNTTDGDDLGDVNRDVARVAIRFTPTDRLEANFAADYSRIRESGVPSVLVGTFEGASLAQIAALANPAGPDFLPPPAPLPAPGFVDLYNLLATVPLGEQGGVAGMPGVVPSQYFGQPTFGQGDVVGVKGNLENLSSIDLSSDTDVWGMSLTLTYDFDSFSVKSITGYRDVDAFAGYDVAAVPQPIGQLQGTMVSDQFSEEIQISGRAIDQRLNWLAGFYYSEEDGTGLDNVEFTAVRIQSGAQIDNRSLAGFAQVTFDVTERLAVTGGIRYTEETKKFKVPDGCYELLGGPATLFDGTVVTCAPMHTIIDPKFLNPGFLGFVNAPVFPAPGGRFCCLPVSDAAGNIVALLPGLAPGDELLPRGTTTESFSDWTPHANITYRWTDDFMTYFTFSEGFKSGGFVQRVFPPRTEVPVFDPETAQMLEMGFKWTGFDNRVRLNAAGFHTDYDDLQIQINDGIAPITRNAAAADIDGFELELTAAPTPQWLVQAGVGYLDAEYTELDPDENFVTDLHEITLDTKLVNAPKWSTAFGLQYTHAFPGGSQLVPRLDWTYRSTVYNDTLNFPELRQDGQHLLDLALTYVSADARWEISAFGKNVTDERYLVAGFANGLTQGYATAVIGRPAEWGFAALYRFGD
jgi:iron complex outermembrane receptor protein